MIDPLLDPRVKSLTERYTGEAQAYNAYWAPVLRGPARLLLDNLEAKGVRRVVDVGTGVGTFLPALKETFPAATVFGADRSDGMLSLVPDDSPLVVTDASHLGIASNSVDVVTFVFMLFHLPDPLQGLKEAHRVLRREGRVATVTWGDEFDSTATKLWNVELDAFGADPLTVENHLAQHDLVQLQLQGLGVEVAVALVDGEHAAQRVVLLHRVVYGLAHVDLWQLRAVVYQTLQLPV